MPKIVKVLLATVALWVIAAMTVSGIASASTVAPVGGAAVASTVTVQPNCFEMP